MPGRLSGETAGPWTWGGANVLTRCASDHECTLVAAINESGQRHSDAVCATFRAGGKGQFLNSVEEVERDLCVKQRMHTSTPLNNATCAPVRSSSSSSSS